MVLHILAAVLEHTTLEYTSKLVSRLIGSVPADCTLYIGDLTTG